MPSLWFHWGRGRIRQIHLSFQSVRGVLNPVYEPPSIRGDNGRVLRQLGKLPLLGRTHFFPRPRRCAAKRVQRPWLEQVVALCARHGVDRGTLLEVGPGFGTFAQLATESGLFARVVAVEPTPEMAAACRARGVEVVEGRIEVAQHWLGAVDVAVAFEVIEHLFEPSVFARGMARCVKPGGLLVLSCPNGT